MKRKYLSIQATVNSSESEIKTLAGQEYTVVPCIALVEGVLWPSNAASPELALAEEFGRFPDGWNGRPIMMNHPTINGSPVSASNPEVLEEFGFGSIFNTEIKDNKLHTELWLNNTRVAELGGEVEETFNRLTSGEDVVEVSTGLYAMAEQTTGDFDGQEYSAIWRNIVPDHLAILSEGTIGACSVEGGCGAPRINNEGDASTFTPAMKAVLLTDDCECGGTCTDCSGDKDSPNAPTDNEKKSPFRRLMEYVGNAMTFKANGTMSDGDVRTALTSALSTQDDEGGWVYVMAVFQESNGKGQVVYEGGYSYTLYRRDFEIAEDSTISISAEKVAVRPQTEFIPIEVTVDGDDPELSINNGNTAMKTKAEQVQSLIDNTATQFTEDSREWLEGLDDEVLATLEPVDNTEGGDTPDDTSASSEETDTDTDADAGDGNSEPTANKSVEQYLADAPDEVRAMLNSGLSALATQKSALIKGIMANARNTFSEDQLNAKDTSELQSIANLCGVSEATDFSLAGSVTGATTPTTNDEGGFVEAPSVFVDKA